jgi:nucleoside 2-deoxyribosyltransferase
MGQATPLVVVGEVFVDFTLPGRGGDGSKLRLGGIIHAARGLWSCGQPYALAAVCPAYLLEEARAYASGHGCSDFIWLGDVLGSPNVIAIGDATEVGAQGYEDLLREARRVVIHDKSAELACYREVLVFPGHFSLQALRSQFHAEARFCFDVAYDVAGLDDLNAYRGNVRGILISTSSPLFSREAASDIGGLLGQAKGTGAEWFLLKENRGGSRLFDLASGDVTHIPAYLGRTVNSVGVGDVYAAVTVGLIDHGLVEAAWRGARAATYYAQTTYPDDLRTDVQRDAAVAVDVLKHLGGSVLPWHERPAKSIYLAAPDFSYVNKPEIERAVASLEYHNFRVRRPIHENGELDTDADIAKRVVTYQQDIALLKGCALVFAVPLSRDAGTLAEVGYALALGMPVVTFDPRNENNNTIIVAGSTVYSQDLDECLCAVFQVLSDLRKQGA